MVKIALLALLAMTATARADDEEVDPSPAFNMFGFRMSAGGLPLEGGRTIVLSLGLAVEHPVFKKTRMFGEYEWLWVSWIGERALDTGASRPDRHGTGHRASFGLRRELLGKNMSRSVRMFVDGELGGNVALINDNMTDMTFAPGGLVGMRLGYDVYSNEDDSPSRTFEAEILIRMIVVEHGAGALTGIGLHWGN
jgi:hypothetical protein